MWKSAPAGYTEKCRCGNLDAQIWSPAFVSPTCCSDAFCFVFFSLLSVHPCSPRSGCDLLNFRTCQCCYILRIDSRASSDVGLCFALGVDVGVGVGVGSTWRFCTVCSAAAECRSFMCCLAAPPTPELF